MSEATVPVAGLAPDTAPSRRWALAGWLWLACVLVVAMHQWQFWRAGRLDTDVLALLPQTQQRPEIARAEQLLAARVSRQVTVLVGAPDWASARQAAQLWRDAMADAHAPMQLRVDAAVDPGVLLDFYRPWRERLLTPAQRDELQASTPPVLVHKALAALHQPGATLRLQAWAADPLGLWPAWLLARAHQSRARPRDGELWVAGEGQQWVLLNYQITGSAFAMSGDTVYRDAIDAATRAAGRTVPGVKVLAAGLPLHAEAAAAEANREINTIGWGSLAAVLLLAWLAFRAASPILLTALSLVVGTATALSVTAWAFGQVHLITLVFGASLVGVAEDYGIHYFASRQGQPRARPRQLMQRLLPGLCLALGTSVLAYLALGLAPFPGLRQMAVFSVAGLVGAFLTVVAWFPLLDRGRPRNSHFAAAISASLARWPIARPTRGVGIALGVAALLSVAGLAQLRLADDIRQWQGAPARLQDEQLRVARLLGVPSVAQFYVVRGTTQQQVLEREEALTARLDAAVARGTLSGHAAASDWIPSQRRQQDDAQLTAHAQNAVLAGVNAALGESIVPAAPAAGTLTPQTWLAGPAAAAARDLWLGEVAGEWTTVVLLHGLHGAAAAQQLANAAQGLPGVSWIDKASETSAVLQRYRDAMLLLLLAGHVAVFGMLWWRYGARAWRAWLPTAGATVLTAALLGWLGQPLQLANVLALLLLLGIGVDYGIFLCEHDGDGAAWLAVVLGAGSTWLAFGLLALSSTPALHAFGLTLLLGVAIVWLASPWLRPGPLAEAGAA